MKEKHYAALCAITATSYNGVTLACCQSFAGETIWHPNLAKLFRLLITILNSEKILKKYEGKLG